MCGPKFNIHKTEVQQGELTPTISVFKNSSNSNANKSEKANMIYINKQYIKSYITTNKFEMYFIVVA